jgi:hypothetical protein
LENCFNNILCLKIIALLANKAIIQLIKGINPPKQALDFVRSRAGGVLNPSVISRASEMKKSTFSFHSLYVANKGYDALC